MGLITEFDGLMDGYEAVPLLVRGTSGQRGWDGALLRWRSVRMSRRAVLYVHAVEDGFVTGDQVAWYTDRGFHVYVADLRGVSGGDGDRGRGSASGPDVGKHATRVRGRGSAAPGGPGERRTGPEDGTGTGRTIATAGRGGTGAAGPSDGPVWDTATFDAVTFDAAGWGPRSGARRARGRPPGGEGGGRAVRRAGAHGAGGPEPAGVAAGRPPGRALPPDVKVAAEELGECFAGLDAVTAYLRQQEAIETVVVAAHGAGALVAAVWAHARRSRQPVDALILANPAFGGRPSWLARMRAAREDYSANWRSDPLLVGARRRIRRGLDITCPVLVMCPAGEAGAPDRPGGWLATRFRAVSRAPIRLGAHVTWLSLDGALPGQAWVSGPDRRRYFEELTRWLGAYLSGEIRDQLL